MEIIHNPNPEHSLLKKIIKQNFSTNGEFDSEKINFKIQTMKDKNIETIYIIENEKITASVLLYPTMIGKIKFFWIFDLYSYSDKGQGILLIKYAMKNIENLCCIGITKNAEKIYKLFKWRKIKNYYRYFKILNITNFLSFYSNRLNIFKKFLLMIHFILFKIINIFNRKFVGNFNFSTKENKLIYKEKEFSIIVSNKILRIISIVNKNEIKLLNCEIKTYLGLEFLTKDKISYLYSFYYGFFRINSPIYYFSKNNINYDEIFYKNINSFNNTDKII